LLNVVLLREKYLNVVFSRGQHFVVLCRVNVLNLLT